MYSFSAIAALLPFLSKALGSEAEILLCDTEHILYAEHPITDRVTPGNRLGDMERSFLEDGTWRSVPYVVNYRALLPSRERLRASTLFLLHEDGSLAGFLTINIRVESLIDARNLMDGLINGEMEPLANGQAQTAAAKKKAKKKQQPQMLGRYEEVTVAMEDIIQSAVDEYVKSAGIPAARLNTSERQQIVRELDNRGVFLVKGAISEVARLLQCSEVTIYRYLNHSSS